METPLPSYLVFENAQLSVGFELNADPNQTRDVVVVLGNRNGFLSLANVLLFFFSSLEDEIRLDTLPFVTSSIRLALRSVSTRIGGVNGRVVRIADDSYVWELLDDDGPMNAMLIHSLGQFICHLHLDEDLEERDISIYCCIE